MINVFLNSSINADYYFKKCRLLLDQECYNHAITITKSEVTTYSFAETTTKKNIPSTIPYRPEYLIQNKVADCWYV